MDFANDDKSLNFIEYQLATEPLVNVFTKDQFEERAKKVFDIIYDKLANSFGPGGAGTFISVYPAYYNTKDGYNIMKNINFDKKLDQVICDMVMDVCSRLNFTVGDGTTTSTIATKTIYEQYLKCKNNLLNSNYLPREIVNCFVDVKNEIITELRKRATLITDKGPDYLCDAIADIVSISSNGDRELTKLISDLYKEIQYPGISCSISKDGLTKVTITNGYKLDTCLADKKYINNDDNTMITGPADIIIFDHKVVRDTYRYLVKPLSADCKSRGRHLICIAPYYDENMLESDIKLDFDTELKKTGDINLVLTVCSTIRSESKVALEDFAMLSNTIIITSAIEKILLDKVTKDSKQSYEIFDIDNRNIDGCTVAAYSDMENMTLKLVRYHEGLEDPIFMSDKDTSELIRVGYVDEAELGLVDSVFKGFYYDQKAYDTHYKDACDELADVQQKVTTMGVYSEQLTQKQRRVFALKFKAGLIEVGSTSDLTRDYLKDFVIDSIKAAASAYNHGVIKGCNVTLLRILHEKVSELEDMEDLDRDANLRMVVMNMILNGFINVYKTVLVNVYGKPDMEDEEFLESIYRMVKEKAWIMDAEERRDLDKIIAKSIIDDMVFDVSKGKFTNHIINSEQTDEEVLTATIDLLSLLITGNQLVLR